MKDSVHCILSYKSSKSSLIKLEFISSYYDFHTSRFDFRIFRRHSEIEKFRIGLKLIDIDVYSLKKYSNLSLDCSRNGSQWLATGLKNSIFDERSMIIVKQPSFERIFPLRFSISRRMNSVKISSMSLGIEIFN